MVAAPPEEFGFHFGAELEPGFTGFINVGDPGLPPGAMAGGPDTVDGIAPAANWDTFWREAAAAKRAAAPWTHAALAPNT